MRYHETLNETVFLFRLKQGLIMFRI